MILPTKGLGPERAMLTIGAEILELRNIERTLQLRIERTQVDRSAPVQSRRVIENTLASRTLTALPGEVFV